MISLIRACDSISSIYVINKSLSYLCNSDDTQESWRGEILFYEVGKEQADEGETDDDEVKDAPAVGEVVVAQSKHLHEHLCREYYNEPENKLF